MVPVAQMGGFVFQHIGLVFRVHIRWQVDSGPDNPQNKGRGYAVTQVDFSLQVHGNRAFPGKAVIADRGIQEHHDHARNPDNGSNCQNDLHGIHAGSRDRCQILRYHWVYCPVNHRDTAVNGRGWGIDDIHRNGFGLGNQAEGAFQRNRQRQTQPHQCPQPEQQILGNPAKKQPQKQNRQNQIARRNALVREVEKDLRHFFSPPP